MVATLCTTLLSLLLMYVAISVPPGLGLLKVSSSLTYPIYVFDAAGYHHPAQYVYNEDAVVGTKAIVDAYVDAWVCGMCVGHVMHARWIEQMTYACFLLFTLCVVISLTTCTISPPRVSP